MITVKAFDKNLRCRGFQYKIGKEYEIPIIKVKIYEKGFHASAHCDISETILYYPNVLETRYCLVDINVVEEDDDEVVGNRIKILRELDLDDCIKYDKTGGWCYKFARGIGSANAGKLIRKLEDAVIQKDQTGEWCFWFAKNIKSANIERLSEAVTRKDKTGYWSYYFTLFVDSTYSLKISQKLKEKFGENNKWYKYLKESSEEKIIL